MLELLLLFFALGLGPATLCALLVLTGHRVRVEGPFIHFDWAPRQG